jgi:ribosome maturation factor RimP
MADKIINKINALLRDEITALGYELWGCTYKSSTDSSILRVFIEKADGITVTDCEKVARHISTVLDVEDPIRSAYHLEVSSPGLDRTLFELSHYQRYIGKKIKIRLHAPIDGRRNIVGILLVADEKKGIIIAEGDREVCVSFDQVERARLEVEV